MTVTMTQLAYLLFAACFGLLAGGVFYLLQMAFTFVANLAAALIFRVQVRLSGRHR